MITRRFAFCVLLLMSFALFSVSLVSAQSGNALVRFGVYTEDGDVHITDTTSNEYFLATNPRPAVQDTFNAEAEFAELTPNVPTKYLPFMAGTLTITLSAAPNDTANAVTQTVDLVAGNRYSIIASGMDEPIVVINETVLQEENPLAPGESSLIVVTNTADGTGASEASFRITPIAESSSALPRDRVEFDRYFQNTITEDVLIERLNAALGDVVSSTRIVFFPDTHIIVNGDALGSDVVTVSPVQYSTPLSPIAWLQGVNNMQNPPFTFTNFLTAATNGGFAEALGSCQNYMWNVFTDDVFLDLQDTARNLILGGQSFNAINNSVHQPASTTPWRLGQTATRGGTPLNYINPFNLFSGSPTATPGAPIGVNGNILLTISTTGNAAQNIINIVNVTPLTDDGAPTALFYTPPALLEAASGG